MLNPEFLDRIDYHPGNADVRYNGLIGGVVNVTSRDAFTRSFQGTVDLSLIGASVFLNAPVTDRVSVAASLRRSYVDAILPWLLEASGNDVQALVPVYYDYQLRNHTSTNMNADEVFALGLAEVERIQQEMDEILRAEGLAEGTVAERMTALNDDPNFLYPDTDDGRERILVDYQTIIDEIDEQMSEWFVTLPKASVRVERVPEFREEGSAGAYYMGPAMDGSRPGTFYANLRDMKGHPKFGMRTLAYHEAVPGHHFQTALQMELKGVPMFRRILGFTAFSEGWALYAERLAWEAGFHTDPYDNLGRLQAELFRAVRLVVDTGIHRKRWTREQAIDYMLANTGMAESDVVAEIERYMVWPGQATAYKVGMMKILALRERAKAALGDAFDIREFHEAVLRNGDQHERPHDQMGGVERLLGEVCSDEVEAHDPGEIHGLQPCDGGDQADQGGAQRRGEGDDRRGELAYHLLFDSASADYLWDCLIDAMDEFDGAPVGATALSTLWGR